MSRAVKALLLVTLALAEPACTGSGAYALRRPTAFAAGPVRISDEECVRWLASRRTWNALSLGFGSGAGGGGALTAAVEMQNGGRIAVGIGTLLLGAMGVLSSALSRGYADDFDRHCATR